MQLIIAEKPSVAQALAEGIGGAQKKNGYYTCAGGRIVTWCIGHMLEQAPPEAYDPALKQWRAETLPFVPQQWKLFPKSKTKAQFNVITKLIGQAAEIVHAGDPDREGQLLVDELLDYVGCSLPTQRLLLSAVDARSVSRALTNFKDNRDFLPLKNAALARQRADWLFGFNVTRAATLAAQRCGVEGVISAGRVQTPTVALVVDRDREIENFVVTNYFVPTILVQHKNGRFPAVWVPPEDHPDIDLEGRLLEQSKAAAIAASANGLRGHVVTAEYTRKQTAPPLPHGLSSLQKAASSRLGLTAAQTLETAQALYDSAITSYPRSDCRYLPEEQLHDAPQILAALANIGIENANNADLSIKTKAWNTKKAPVHHGIIPTGSFPRRLTEIEQGLFEIIAESYICQFYPNVKSVSQQVVVEVDSHHWKARGTKVVDLGWKKVFKDNQEDGRSKPIPDAMQASDPVKAVDCTVQAKKTQPPRKFTDGTLIEAMGSIHKFVTDPKIKKTLKESSGIGTVATQANIIEVDIKRKYLKRDGKYIVSTKLGREIRDRLPTGLCDPGTTAAWEDLLKQVEAGDVDCDWFVNSVTRVLPSMVQASLEVQFSSSVAQKKYPCPVCGSPLRRLRSKKNKKFVFWACSNKDHPLLRDNKGKPGEVIDFDAQKNDNSPMAPCPEEGCTEQMRQRTSKKNSDYKFWACPNQKHPLRKDNNGQPGDVLTFKKKKSSKGRKKTGGEGGRKR
jgi:DNA topoisomerase-3